MVAFRGEGVERDVHGPHEQVGDAEQDAVVAEGLGHSEGGDQHRAHGREHRQPHGALFGVQRVRQPGVGGPGPPERAQDEHPAQDPAPGRVVGEQARDLRDREDEDEVEEKLERSDALLVGGRSLHAETLSTAWAALAEYEVDPAPHGEAQAGATALRDDAALLHSLRKLARDASHARSARGRPCGARCAESCRARSGRRTAAGPGSGSARQRSWPAGRERGRSRDDDPSITLERSRGRRIIGARAEIGHNAASAKAGIHSPAGVQAHESKVGARAAEPR